MAKHSRKNAIAGQFAARPIAMLESPAYRTLSRAAHQVLARLEIEHAHHGGADNGALPVPYDHFVEYGLHRHAIAPALRELVILGFVEITRHGSAGNAEFRQAALYRLTYRHAKGEAGDGTHEWRRVLTIDEAGALVEQARKNKKPVPVSAKFQCRKPSPKTPISSVENRHYKASTETVTTSISGEGHDVEERLAKRALQGAVASEPPHGDEARPLSVTVAAALENLQLKIVGGRQ